MMRKSQRFLTTGPRLTRSETVTIRLDPRMRYLAELAARKERRSVSSFIEGAVDDVLHRVHLREEGPTLHAEAVDLWDVDEDDRFRLLATHHPELLNFTEQMRVKRERKAPR